MQITSNNITLEEFLAGKSHRNLWFKNSDMEVYLRRSIRQGKPCIDIANVTVFATGKGTFRKFLEYLTQVTEHPLFCEQVLSERFAKFFRELNWKETKDLANIPSFYLER